jgi:pyrroloquinoline-quinone synthase
MVNKLVEVILKETAYENNPYFVNLKNGEFSEDDFIETQIQFYSAVIFFSRPMAALAAKIPTAALRVEIVRNVWEEHGEGSLERVHGNTFAILLSRLGGITEQDIRKRALWPEIRCFNTVLAGASVLDDYLVASATMGIIERMFVDISLWLGKGIVERGWLKSDQMIHYNLHQNLDIKHSKDFFDVLQPAWDEDVKNRYLIRQGLTLGAYVFNGLYSGLYYARKRRDFVDPASLPKNI